MVMTRYHVAPFLRGWGGGCKAKVRIRVINEFLKSSWKATWYGMNTC